MGFYQEITNTYGFNTTRSLKQWANINIKLANKVNRRIFLLQCKKFKIVPLHIIQNSKHVLGLLTTPNTRIRKDLTNFNSRLGYRILDFEIRITVNDINYLNHSLDVVINSVFNILPQNIFVTFLQRMERAFQRKFTQVRSLNLQKFNRLKQSQIKDKLFKDNKKWLKNLTNIMIPPDIENFLSLGPKFSIQVNSKKLHVGGLLADVESILEDHPRNVRDLYRARVTNVITNFLHKNNDTVCQGVYNETRNFLKANPNILITRADKGAVTVIIDKNDYIRKAKHLLDDTQTYIQLNSDPTFTTQKKNNDLVKYLKQKNCIDEGTVKLLTIHAAITPKFYGLPKIHKQDVPLRPIVSSIDSPTFKLAGFVGNILATAFKDTNQYNVKDSFDFASEFNNFQLPPHYVVISLDVVSLFTNIPLDMVIQIIQEKWQTIDLVCSFNQEQFIQIINFIFNNTYFSFNDKFFKQIFGTPMGSPLSPIIATMVMDSLFDYVIPRLPFQPPFIKKYVDDVICAIPSDLINQVQAIFNSFNPHLQFTVEEEENNSIPFLDTKIIRNENNILILDWYQKPTNSGRYINYYSHHPLNQKVNIIKAMKNRIIKIAHPSLREKNLIKLSDIFCNNGYPRPFVNKLLFSTPAPPRVVPHTNNAVENIVYRRLPYVEEITCHLIKILKKDNIKIAQYNVCTINHLFSKLKTRTPVLGTPNTIYSIPCLNCDQIYIGQSSQWLRTRLTQHRSDSKIKKRSCALSIHSNENNHCMNYDEVKILDVQKHYKSRLFLEMFHIYNNPKCMNFKTDTDNLSCIYANILNLKAHQNDLNYSLVM